MSKVITTPILTINGVAVAYATGSLYYNYNGSDVDYLTVKIYPTNAGLAVVRGLVDLDASDIEVNIGDELKLRGTLKVRSIHGHDDSDKGMSLTLMK